MPAEAEVQTAAAAIDAWNRIDLPAFLETWHADAEWRPAFPQGTEGAGSVFRGNEQIARAWESVRAAWAEYRVEADEVRIVGENLLILGRIYARGARSEVEIDSAWSAVVRFRDGKIISAWDWLDHESGIEAVGTQAH
jgi:ketosteroid isomerase-like protein